MKCILSILLAFVAIIVVTLILNAIIFKFGKNVERTAPNKALPYNIFKPVSQSREFHLAIEGGDLEKSIHFYHKILGRPLGAREKDEWQDVTNLPKPPTKVGGIYQM